MAHVQKKTMHNQRETPPTVDELDALMPDPLSTADLGVASLGVVTITRPTPATPATPATSATPVGTLASAGDGTGVEDEVIEGDFDAGGAGARAGEDAGREEL